MDLVVIIVVAAVVAVALAAYMYLSTRATTVARVPAGQPLAVPRTAGLKLRPLPDVGAVMRPTVEPVAAPPAAAPPPAAAAPPAAAPAPSAPLFDIEHEPSAVSPPVEIRWSKRFDPRSGTLDEMARLRLIGDLGVVAKEWCVPLLAQAYDEERRPGHRQAALIALAACRSRAAMPTFRLALASDDPAERAIANDAITDLEPPPQVKSKRTVERN